MEKQTKQLKEMTYAALLCAVLCVLSPISIPTSAVPFTLGLLGVFLIGMLLKPKWAAMAVLGYLLLGMVGVPVFSGFRGGVDVLFGMTGGFLMAYLPMVLMLSFAAQTKKTPLLLLSVLMSLLVCYALGTVWFVFVTKSTVGAAITMCVLPYIPFDLIKAAAAFSLLTAISKYGKKRKAEN